MRIWPKVGMIVLIRYGSKYPGMSYQGRHARVLIIARSKPMNVLVELRDGSRLVVPIGNLLVER
jgi:hypothetical protein